MKIGIIGTGMIVPGFLEACAEIEDIHIEAICGRTKEKVEKFSQALKCKSFYDYDKMLEDSSIDTIYIALPNHLHYAYTKKALLQGKNVVCEKPFMNNLDEAKELVQLAKDKELFLFEAITNQYLPNYEKIKQLIPTIGNIRIVQLNYSQYSSRYDAFKRGEILPAFDVNKSGGALMDLGVYNIYFIVGLFGKPQQVEYLANVTCGIDTSGVLLMDYGTFKCVSVQAKDCMAPLSINIQGDLGTIHCKEPSSTLNHIQFMMNRQEPVEYTLNTHSPRLYEEMAFFNRMVHEKDYKACHEMMGKSLIVMEILDKARQSAGIQIVR